MQFTRLGDELARFQGQSEHWENEYARSDQEHARFKRKVMAELKSKEDEITEMKARAVDLERENERVDLALHSYRIESTV